MPIFLNHIEGGKTGQVESFDQEQIRIGRQADNDLRFDPQRDASVSGYHAEIYRDGETFFVKDLQSRNGTFVNSRKIDQPVRLNEGDILQFSARGPKLIFSTRDPSLASETAVMDAGAVGRTGVVAAEEKPSRKLGIWEKMQHVLPIAGAIVALLALVGLGRYLGFYWSGLLIGSSVVFLFTGSGYLGWRYWKRRKALREQKEVARDEREASLGRGDKSDLQEIRRKWMEVVRSLKDSKLNRTGDEPIYALPWFVIIGEPGSGKSALIKASGPLSSVTTPGQDGHTRNCDWWFFDKLLVLDTSGRYAFQAKGSESAGEWQELVNLLRTNRRKEPVNGVLIALPADSLASKPVDKLKEQAAQLRERLDEMAQRLGVKFPVYVAITKSDFIAGFKEFFEALPDQVKGQALGYVNSETVSNADAVRFFEKAFRTMCERAERLRLAMMYEEGRDGATRGIYLFPAELSSLHSPLKAFVEVLFRPSPYRDTPFFRGLFLTSARQAGTPLSRLSRLLGLRYAHHEPSGAIRDLFLRDLFTVILPNDRALVGSTALGRERSQLTRAAGLIVAVAAALLLCGLFTLSFTNNWLALARLDIQRCTKIGTASGPIAEILRPLDNCRESIEDLIPGSIWKKIAFNFGLGYAQYVGELVQGRYMTDFRSQVLNPIDDRIDKSLASDSADALVVSLIIQRLERLGTCQRDGRCSERMEPNGINYRTMLAVAQAQTKEGDPAIDRLQRTHESYLIWQTDPKVLRDLHSKDLERVRNWSRREKLTEQWVLESTRAQFAPVRASDYWGINAPLQVDGAYTARAWKEGISLLVAGLQKMAGDEALGEALKKFQQDYRGRALNQWENFLAKFPDAENSLAASAITREFGSRVLGPDSPYNRAIDMANANLSVVLGETWRENSLQPWAAQLKRYVALKRQIQQTGKQAPQEKEQRQDEQAVKYLAMYLDAVGEFRADFGAPDKCFKSAQKAFQEGEVSSKATHPVLKATWALGALKDSIGSRRGEDAIFWALLERPLALAWRAMLAETGRQLQEQWYKLRLGVKTQQDAGVVSERIYGFAIDGPAAPFLAQGNRWAPRRLLNQSVQFTDPFLLYLSRLRIDAISKPTGYQSASAPEPPPYIVRTN